MLKYWAIIEVHKVIPVEVEANSEWEAEEAIRHNQYAMRAVPKIKIEVCGLIPVIPIPGDDS